jgi:hypothetical protein
MSSRIEFHESIYNAMLYTNGVTILMVYGRRIEGYAKKIVRVRTGNLKTDIETRFMSRAGMPVVQVGVDTEYGAYVHTGTGIYGPRRQRIVPKRGKYLVFRGRDGRLVFAKSVRGMRPNQYLTRAMNQVFR